MDKDTQKWIAELQAMPEYIAEGLAMDLTADCEKRREELGLSYAEIARRMGVSRQRVHKLFTGTQNSTIGSLVKLAIVLGGEINIELSVPTAQKSKQAVKKLVVKAGRNTKPRKKPTQPSGEKRVG